MDFMIFTEQFLNFKGDFQTTEDKLMSEFAKQHSCRVGKWLVSDMLVFHVTGLTVIVVLSKKIIE
jgi:hypothetical protein